MSQSAVNDQAAPFAGVVGDNSPNYVRSAVNEATASMPFGTMAIQGTNDDQALEAVVGGLPIGVVTHSHRYAKPGQLDSVGLTTLTEMGLLRKGTIFVVPEDAVSPGDPVRIRHAGVGVKGAFLTGATVAETAVVANAAWLTSAAGGATALLEVDLTAEGVIVSD